MFEIRSFARGLLGPIALIGLTACDVATVSAVSSGCVSGWRYYLDEIEQIEGVFREQSSEFTDFVAVKAGSKGQGYFAFYFFGITRSSGLLVQFEPDVERGGLMVQRFSREDAAAHFEESIKPYTSQLADHVEDTGTHPACNFVRLKTANEIADYFIVEPAPDRTASLEQVVALAQIRRFFSTMSAEYRERIPADAVSPRLPPDEAQVAELRRRLADNLFFEIQ